MNPRDQLRNRLKTFARVPLAHLPTPFEGLSHLSREHAPLQLFIKRDDQTGLAFGGNKSRKLEFIMADVVEKKADSVLTWAGVQSNWCRQTAAAAARIGAKPVLVLLRKPSAPIGVDGNLLLDHLFGADVRILEAVSGRSSLELENVRPLIDPVLEELRAAGHTTYVAPIGGSLPEGSMERPLGAIAYVGAFLELLDQAESAGAPLDAVVLATGSAGTQAGLLAGARVLSPHTKIVGISVSEDRHTMSEYVRRVAAHALQELGAPVPLGARDVIVLDDYLGEGYGVLNQQVTDAIRVLATTEGILLDPVYTGKAMAGMLDLLRKGYFDGMQSVVFLHTGGTPALFPYRDSLLSLLGT